MEYQIERLIEWCRLVDKYESVQDADRYLLNYEIQKTSKDETPYTAEVSWRDIKSRKYLQGTK